jgi:catechol 2,3-dioxygenase-like lactoylglutathione lyase family enzyme
MRAHNGIGLIDHPVIAARDLDAARIQFERLGFTVPPRGSHVEWGTGNLCIMFPDDYLEIRGIIDASRFTMHLDEHLDAFGEGLMGVAFGTADIDRSHGEMKQAGINAGNLQRLSRNFEHPEGWTQPSFKLCAPAAEDIEGLMHVVVIQHLTPELLRRPEFLAHTNSCIGVNALAGTIYEKRRVADKLRRLLGDNAVSENVDGVRAVLESGQRLELLLPVEYARNYGEIPVSPEDGTPRLGNLTLRVASTDALRDALAAGGIGFDERPGGQVVVAGEHACGATLLFTESPPA